MIKQLGSKQPNCQSGVIAGAPGLGKTPEIPNWNVRINRPLWELKIPRRFDSFINSNYPPSLVMSQSMLEAFLEKHQLRAVSQADP
jgi:hypothetical protein